MIELLVVIAIIAILAGLLLPAVIGGVKRAELTQAKSEVSLLATAMTAYLNDYSKFPGQSLTITGLGVIDHTYTDYNLLVATLRGTNHMSKSGYAIKDMLGTADCNSNWNNQNSRNKVYLNVSDKSIATNGTENLDDAIVATKGDLADPWGNRYVVVADWSMDGKVSADGETVFRKVAVWSWGPDVSAVPPSVAARASYFSPTNTSHIRSWRN